MSVPLYSPSNGSLPTELQNSIYSVTASPNFVLYITIECVLTAIGAVLTSLLVWAMYRSPAQIHTNCFWVLANTAGQVAPFYAVARFTEIALTILYANGRLDLHSTNHLLRTRDPAIHRLQPTLLGLLQQIFLLHGRRSNTPSGIG